MIQSAALTVSQVNSYIKILFDSDERLRRVTVTGEIANFVRHYRSGHMYFSLKDESSSLKCVMFASSAAKLRFEPENGLKVYACGRLTTYERDGVYQLVCDSIEPVGAGLLAAALEQLKKRLAAEGLFDSDRKKPLPPFPRKIGVVTSASGAALRDIENVLSRRYPLAEIILCPAAVQGANCGSSNAAALETLNERGDADVIILGRGGGSQEDLWGYNDERLVRAIAASKIPVITGIGHEIDTSLSDLAADMRAPTPSAAAELCVLDISDLYQSIDDLTTRVFQTTLNTMSGYDSILKNIIVRLRSKNPSFTLDNQSKQLELMNARIENAIGRYIDKTTLSLKKLDSELERVDPTALLKQGRPLVKLGADRLVSVTQIKEGDTVKMTLVDGTADCSVTRINKW